MKRQNFKLFGTLAILVGMLFSYQSVFGDILLRKDNTDPGSIPNIVSSMSISSTSSSMSISSTSMSTLSTSTTTAKTSSSAIYIEADVYGSNLVVDFNKIIGIAYITVVDHSGNTVAFEIVNTFFDDEAVISLRGLSRGNYNLKISYGSTKLIGTFHY
jgi:hypothetical protein